MIIKYTTSKFINETKTIEIEDTKNIFLQGKNPYDNTNTYFGILENEQYLVIATIISNRSISYSYSTNKSVYTEADIKLYLHNNNNVTKISKDQFQEQLYKIKEIIKIWKVGIHYENKWR